MLDFWRSPRCLGLVIIGLLCTTLIDCASGGTDPIVPAWVPSASDQPFLVDPLVGFEGAGYDGEQTAESATVVRRGYQALLAGDVDRAREVAENLLDEVVAWPPAIVLLAQTEFAEREYRAVTERLEAVRAAAPAYSAAQLLAGRAFELLGELPEAYGALFEVDTSGAQQQRERLFPRTIEVLGRRAEAALGEQNAALAAASVETLKSWAPEERVTAVVWQQLAELQNDRPGELEALRLLVRFDPEDRVTNVRRAALELEVGDPGAGLRLYQDLDEKFPEDQEIVDGLAQASFIWRMQLLPEGVGEIYRAPELSRGQFAALLYWLFPDVRYGETGRGTIASDILEHSFRDEIVKVINLSLLSVDPGLHTFFPDRPIDRSEVMRGLLGVLNRSNAASCLRGALVPDRGASDLICSLASRCGVLADATGCLPTARMSGEEAVQLTRKTLERLEN